MILYSILASPSNINIRIPHVVPVEYRVERAEYGIQILVAASQEYVNSYSIRSVSEQRASSSGGSSSFPGGGGVRDGGWSGLHVEYAERGKEYDILFIFSLFCEYEYVRIHAIHKVNQAEYGIHILVAASQEYVNSYSTSRPNLPPTTTTAEPARSGSHRHGDTTTMDRGGTMGQIGWGGPSTGPTLFFGAAGVSPFRCEPLRAGCYGWEGVSGVS